MAAPSVTAQATRIDAADSGSTTANIGGGAGAGAEPDILYQGSGGTPEDVSRKIGTSQAGFALTPTAADISTGSGTYQTLIYKYAAANFAALETVATQPIEARIGSGASDYALYDLEGVDTYPAKGGFIIRAIDPNISGYRTSTVGTPALTAADYFGITADFSATSKSENLVLSAVDAVDGLTLIGGDGASTDAAWSDLSDFDAGTLANRYGIFTPLEGLDGYYRVLGMIVIGSATETDFTDSDVVTIFDDGYFAAGWAGVTIDLTNSNSVFSNTNHTYDSLGNTTTTDTRPVYSVDTNGGTAGSGTEANPKFNNWASIDLDIDFTMTTPTIDNCGAVTQNGGTITGGRISNTTATAALVMDDDSLVSDVSIENNAIGIDATAAIASNQVTIDGIQFSGNTTDITVNSANDIQLIMTNGANATTCTNTGAGSCSIINGVTVSVTAKDATSLANVQGARVLLTAANGGNLPFEDSVTITRSGSTATVSHTAHGLSNGDEVVIEGAVQDEYNGIKTISNVSTNAYDFTVSGTPTTPATGTITSTAVVLNGDTNASGVIQDTGFNYSADQPVEGRVRKGTATTYYKTSLISGTITTAGFSTTNFLIRDE